MIGIQAFHFDFDETVARLKAFIEQEKYFVFVAKAEHSGLVSFIALYESYALYAEGAFGTIPELFIRPRFRSQNTGRRLIEQAKAFGKAHGWTRLEVTTPPLPPFDKKYNMLMVGSPPLGKPEQDARIQAISTAFAVECEALGVPYIGLFSALSCDDAYQLFDVTAQIGRPSPRGRAASAPACDG